MKKYLSLFLAFVMLVCSLALNVTALDLATFNSKLSSFKSTQYSNNSTYVNNPSKTGGYQCFGFANELALWIFGSYPTSGMGGSNINSGWSRTYGGSGVDNLAVGDIVRYYYHSIFITGISGDTIYYAQANVPSGTNKVTYDNTVSRSSLRTKVDSKLTHEGATTKGWVAHCTSGIPSASCSCSTSYAGEYTTKDVNSTLTIRSGHGTSYSVLGSIPANAKFTVSKADGSWAHITYNGISGYVSCSYIQRVANNQKDTRYPMSFKAYCISDDNVPAYDSVNGANVGSIFGSQDRCEILEVYTNGWVKLICPWPGYDNGRVVYVPFSVFLSDTSYAPRNATAVNKTEAHWIYNGTSSPGYVYVNDTCLIIGERGNEYCIICPWKTNDYEGHYMVWCNKSAFTHSHSYGGWSNYDATYHARYCDCGSIDKSTHSWNSGVTSVYPGCEKTGTKTLTCTVCGATKTQSISATGHSYDSGIISSAPTCTSTGIKTYTCSNCDSIKTETISKDSSNHSGSASVVKNKTDATCTASGYSGDIYWSCCNTLSEQGTIIIALGHDYSVKDNSSTYLKAAATCTTAAVYYYKCSRCTEKGTSTYTSGNSLGHKNSEWIIDKEATTTAAGSKHIECTVCHVTLETEMIPMLKPEYIPGDINGDGEVNNKDLTRLMKYLADNETEVVSAALDVNGDKAVNNKDLTRLMKFIAGDNVEIF